MKRVFVFFFIAVICQGQREAKLPLSPISFRPIVRGLTPTASDVTVEDIIIRHYKSNSSPKSYKINKVKSLLNNSDYDVTKPTVLYAHGYVELSSDESVGTVVDAYLKRGDHNVLLVDWSKLSFGNYLLVSFVLPMAGVRVGKALHRLVKRGQPINRLHLVGHSMGAHLMAYSARYLSSRGMRVPRLTGLDPAYPGFYPPLVTAHHITKSDADFVDVIHTDGGGFGTPTVTAHVDFWPNGGQAKQPGCVSASIPLTSEDFCSHYRSWAFWAESLNSDQFLARRCGDYDSFLRGQCSEETTVLMGIKATPDLRGNYYLKTAAKSPYALGERGAS